MKRSKVPFDRSLFHELIEKEDWYGLWILIENTHSVNITEDELRIAFGVIPKQYTFRNLYNWGNRFSIDFLREFADRFTYRIFDCIKPKQKHSRVFEEFVEYFIDDNELISECKEFTDILKYEHDFQYIKKYYDRINYARVFGIFGNKEKFDLPKEEIEFLIECAKAVGWGNYFK